MSYLGDGFGDFLRILFILAIIGIVAIVAGIIWGLVELFQHINISWSK